VKLIIAVIQPTKLRAVQQALSTVGVERMTITDSQEFPRLGGRVPITRGVEHRADVSRKVNLEIAVNDDFVEKTIEAICTAAKTGQLGNDGDGKIFVLPTSEAIQLTPDRRGKSAI